MASSLTSPSAALEMFTCRYLQAEYLGPVVLWKYQIHISESFEPAMMVIPWAVQ